VHGHQRLGGKPVGPVGNEAPAEVAQAVGERVAARDVGAGVIVLQRLGAAGGELPAAFGSVNSVRPT
jgi:hypothetical protein